MAGAQCACGGVMRATRRAHALLLGALAIAACSDSAQTDDGESNFILDPTTPDPNNVWMQGVDAGRLAIGEEVVLPDEAARVHSLVDTTHAMQDALASRN